MSGMKTITKILTLLGTLLTTMLAIPGVGDAIANTVQAIYAVLLAGHPKLAIASGVVALVVATLHNPKK